MIEILFETGINILETLISVDFITRYLGPKYKGGKKYAAFVAVWLIAFIQMTITNYITEFETFGAYIPVVIYAIYAFSCLKGSKMLKLWAAILTHMIVVFTAILTNVILCNIIGYDPYKMITVFNSTRVFGVMTAKALQFALTRILLRYNKKNHMSRERLVTLTIIPVISIISLSALMKAVLINNMLSHYILTGMLCIILANVLTYYFFNVLNNEYENKMNTKLVQQQNEILKESIKDSDAFVSEMKTVRHDIQNQFLTILKFADEGKTAEIKDYINVLTNNHLPKILNYINTNNAAFDAILNTKIAVCSQNNIFVEVSIKKNTVINLPPSEMAILFGNLLDNAIEAAKETEERRVAIDIHTSGIYLVVLVTNSILSSVLEANKNLETSKKNKELHGIGIKSIKNIVDEHNGMIQFYEEENEFCCHVMLDATE